MTRHRKNKANKAAPPIEETSAKADGSSASVKVSKAALPPSAPKLKSKKEEETVKEPGSILKLLLFFKEAKKELGRVHWPNRKETFKSTGVLLILVAISAVYLALVDGILTRLLRLVVE
ncbi:MAG: preprotein translocase subunit SecE [Deltaproteobacteria bacterium]|jgi:preprotein translocase subunit SecE|nr:preprotein translocase subunit SecE [Deltaproteobacteria bacterium]